MKRQAALQRELPASARIPYRSHVSPHLVRTEAGDYVQVFRLAGASFADTVRVVEPGKALQIDREPLFDLLADRMDLLQGVFSAVFQRQGRAHVGRG